MHIVPVNDSGDDAILINKHILGIKIRVIQNEGGTIKCVIGESGKEELEDCQYR